MLDPGCHWLWPPCDEAILDPNPTCLRKREPDLHSGPWGPSCINANGSGDEKGEVNSQGCLIPGPAPCTAAPFYNV